MLVAAVLVWAGPALAAEVGTEPAGVERLDLAACIERALVAAPDLATARAAVDVREAKLARARRSKYLPEAGLLSTTGAAPRARGRIDADSSCRGNPQCLAENRVRDTTSTRQYGPFSRVEVGFVQPLWTWGKITAGIEAATAAVEQEVAASAEKRAEVVEQVKTLYYNVLLARAVEGVVVETRDAFVSALKTARERREKGDAKITELDILNLRVGVAEVAKEIPHLQAGAIGALEALRRLMGLPLDAPVDLKDRRLEPEETPLRPLEEYEATLFRTNPAWKQIVAGVEAKSNEVKKVEADYFPNVFVKGGFEYSYAPERTRQINPFAYDDYNYLRGPGGELGVSWLLNFHVTAAKVATKRAELVRLESEQRSAQTGLPVELRDTYRRVLQTREALEQLVDGRKAGRAILTFAVTNFDLGIGEPTDIFAGLGNYGRVSSNYFEAVRDHNLARAALARLMGEAGAAPAASAVP